MKKIFFAILVILIAVFLYSSSQKSSKSSSKSESFEENGRKTITNSPEKSFLFVPDWTLSPELAQENYDSFIYFGLTANENGVEDKSEKMDLFLESAPESSQTLVAVRMLDQEMNSKILKNSQIQKKIIDQSIAVAQEHDFDGIVLDFETASLGFDTVKKRINDFYKEYYKEAKNNNLYFFATVYGDSYYRERPYDIKFISENSDGIMIMTYDFHKARGNPGPVFPFDSKDTYGYDFVTMVDDFLHDAKPDKLIIIFGMFGYDWEVDQEDKSQNTASALSLNQINAKFENSTGNKNGNSIEYSNDQGIKHIIWFESINSKNKKIEYLESLGLHQMGYWAYGYF